MPIINRIGEFHDELTAWRRELHMYPETAFEEKRTAAFVAGKLGGFGVDEIHTGIAGTGVVAVLRAGDGGRSVALRADMDALDIEEENTFPHRSRNPGKMHACGHDGHTTMLLGAARYLAETRNFDGTVYFVFQPAEENEGGARAMVEEGLFERFPADAVYAMHNSPGLPVGRFTARSGPAMAGFDIFEIAIDGYGTHAARPHQGIDPIVVQAQIVTALQTIASRAVDPIDSVVLSVTQVHGGETWNVIPEHVVLRGTVRAFRPEVQDLTEARIRAVCEGVAAAFGASVAVRYERRYPPVVNDEHHVGSAAAVAEEVFGPGNVRTDAPPGMGSEDFSFMLNERPGAYVRIGNGAAGETGGVVVHNPHYDFNDEALTWGASYWSRLVETVLARP